MAQAANTGSEPFSEGPVTYFRGDNGKWYFNIKAPNHEIVAQSEGYSSLAKAKKGAAAVRTAMTGGEEK